MLSSSVIIAIACSTVPLSVAWVLLRYQNYQRMSRLAVYSALGCATLLASLSIGNRLRGINGLGQPWDRATAVLSVIIAAVGVIGAEPFSRVFRAKAQGLVSSKIRDPLTGLHNRLFFDDLLAQLLARQKRQNTISVSLILADINNFKSINDTHGHLVGDLVLRCVGDRFAASIRGGEVAVRWSGDEFIIVLEADEIGSAKAALRLHSAITAEPVTHQNKTIEVHCTMGIATAHGGTPESLLSQANQALYLSKQAGSNRVQVGPIAESYLALEAQVTAAVANGEIIPYFQPAERMNNGEIVGAESLARWEHDGIVDLPATFLPIVMANPALTRQFCDIQLRLCCEQIKRWEGKWDGWVSFNLSQESLKLEDPAGWLQAGLEAAGVDPFRFAVETTERLQRAGADLSNELSHLDGAFQELLDSQLSVLLDDFAGPGGGSGTQFWWMLMALAPGIEGDNRLMIKLDRAIVSGIDKNPALRLLTGGLIQTFHRLNFCVIAEGIETEGEARVLRDMGCDLGQGWWRGRAIPAAEFEETWMKKQEAPGA